MKLISCLKRTKRHLGVKDSHSLSFNLTLQSQVSRSIPKPTNWHCKVRCFSSLVHQHLILHRTQVSRFFLFPTFDTIKCLFPIDDNKLRCPQRDSNSPPDAKSHPLCYESPRISTTPPCQQREAIKSNQI